MSGARSAAGEQAARTAPAEKTAARRGAKPRVAIVVAELGIPSEVWILRQCAEFERIEPVILYWRSRGELPEHIECRSFHEPFARPKSLLRRAARRLGLTSSLLPDLEQAQDIRKTVQDADVEAVFCHFAWSGLSISKAMGDLLPVVWQVHGRDVSSQMRDRAYRRAVAQALPSLDHLVAVGRFQIDLLRPFGLSERHSVIPCGAPISLFAQGDLPVRRSAEPVRFISVGRLSPEKGVLETLSAFEQVAAQQPDVELVFIGGGPSEKELSAAAARSPVAEKVRLLGVLPPEEVARALQGAHIYVQHSRQIEGWVEGFGVTLTEAGASGLPLVASRLGGIVDQVRDGENGFLFNPGDVEEQARLMALLARDEDLRRQVGRAAREVAREFDSRRMTGQLEEVLLQTLSRRRRK